MTYKIHVDRDGDLIQTIWGRYLREERRYDAWGNLGKLLVILEVLADEGFDLAYLIKLQVDFQKLVNLVFPRSFEFRTDPKTAQLLAGAIEDYFQELYQRYYSEGMNIDKIDSWVSKEVTAKFGITVEELDKILSESLNKNLNN